jgi:hypothetical protein
MGAHVMTVGQKQMARRLKSKGMKFKEIARAQCQSGSDPCHPLSKAGEARETRWLGTGSRATQRRRARGHHDRAAAR